MPTGSLLKYLFVLVVVFLMLSFFGVTAAPQSQTAAANGQAPVLSATPALKLFMQLGSDPNWMSLPSSYGAFYLTGYMNVPNVSAMPQNPKMQYIAVGTVPKYYYPNYPVATADLNASDENTFLHST